MLNGVTMKINVDDYIINTLKEDITSEDVSTNAVMPENKQGKADLICKQDGIVCGLDVFERTFKILDDTSRFEANFKDGDFVKKGDLIGVIYGDVNGDGVVDGFDASSMDLAINNKAALTGAYKTAGGLATGKVDLANYGLVVDAAYGGTAIAQK